MLCPQCGKDCGEGYAFCLSCGSRLDGSVQQIPNVPENNLYSQNFEGLNYNDIAPVGGAAVVSKRNGGAGVKKFLIIALVAVVVAAIGIAAYFFIRNKAERDYLVNNPTKYVFSSYQTYFDNTSTDEDIYTILKDSMTQGTVKLSADIDYSYGTESQKAGAAFQYAYDIPNRKYYVMADGGALLPMLSYGMASSEDSNALFELYTDINRVDFNFDVAGKQGKYYIDSGKFREQITDSIFSPDKDNVLNVTKEEFENFISTYESVYHSMAGTEQAKSNAESTYDDLIKKIEEEGKVTIEDGKVTVNGTEVSVDVVTYTFNYDSVIALLNDIKMESINYLNKNKETISNYEQSVNEINESYDKLISEFSENANKNISIVVKNYLDKNNKEAVKLELTLDNYNSSDSAENNHLTFSLEFAHTPNMAINLVITDGQKSITGSLKKEISGSVTSYVFSIQSAENSQTNEVTQARLDFDKANKTFTLTAGGQSYSGTAEIKDKTITLGYDYPLEAMGTSYGKIAINVEISSVPKMNTIDAQTNLFDMTASEFEALTEQQEQVYTFDDYDDLYTNYDDTDYDDEDYDYEYFSFGSDSDAAMVESACKTYYSGIVAGTITSDSEYVNDTVQLPSKGASVSERKAAAENATIGGALNYMGIDNISDSSLQYFKVTLDGVIIASNPNGQVVKQITLSKSTTLGELYNS